MPLFSRIMRRLRGEDELTYSIPHSQQIANWLAHQRQRNPKLRATLLPVSRLCLEKENETTVAMDHPTMSNGLEHAWRNPQTMMEVEKMIMNQGLDETVMHIAVRHPTLTELLTDPRAYERFVERENIPALWKKRLLALTKIRNPELRGMGLLVYLRNASPRNGKR